MKISIRVQKFLLGFVLLIVVLAVLPKQGISALSIGEILIFSAIGFIGVSRLMKEFDYASYSMNIMHWIFVLFFFVLAPVIQIALGYNPWGVTLTTNEIVTSGVFVLMWIISYMVGNSFGDRIYLRIDVERDEGYYDENVSTDYVAIITVLSIICAVIIISQTGLSNMFARNTSGLSYESTNSKMWSLIISRCTRATIVYAVSFTLVEYLRKGEHLFALILNSIILLITCFPTSLARNTAGSIYIGIIILLFSRNINSFRKSGKFVYIFLLGFMIVFPAINVFRRTDFLDVNMLETLQNVLDNITENYLSADYDAFSVIGDTVRYVKANGIEWGYQLLGAAFFFVPRSIWKSKPYGSGQTIFEWMGASFTNISCPLLAEGYINFGIIGIIIFGFAAGIIARCVDRKYWENIDRKGVLPDYLTLLYPFLIIMYFFMLRGDLMTTWAYTAAYIVVFKLLHSLMRVKLK